MKFWDFYPPKTPSYFQGINLSNYFQSFVQARFWTKKVRKTCSPIKKFYCLFAPQIKTYIGSTIINFVPKTCCTLASGLKWKVHTWPHTWTPVVIHNERIDYDDEFISTMTPKLDCFFLIFLEVIIPKIICRIKWGEPSSDQQLGILLLPKRRVWKNEFFDFTRSWLRLVPLYLP